MACLKEGERAVLALERPAVDAPFLPVEHHAAQRGGSVDQEVRGLGDACGCEPQHGGAMPDVVDERSVAPHPGVHQIAGQGRDVGVARGQAIRQVPQNRRSWPALGDQRVEGGPSLGILGWEGRMVMTTMSFTSS
jgi:hypothetical protein